MDPGFFNQSAIFFPFFGMMMLTLAVWLYMYVRRLRFLFANNINARSVRTPEQLARLIPESINYPSDNLKNLFELPVLFYAVCLYLYAVTQVDALHLICAWLFLAFRIVHSAVQCTLNIVLMRFAAYVLASLALWVMILRSAWRLFSM